MTGLPFPTFDAEPLCAEVDPDLMFPEMGGATREAKALCRRCELQDACLSWALANDESGVWGGTSENERDAMRTKGGRRQADINHGTEGGYRTHLRRGLPVPPGDPCGCLAGNRLATETRKRRAAA